MQEVKEDILRLWEEKQLRITDEIQTAPEVLYANGSVIGTLGNFSASTGKAKSKKTFNVAAIVGASLVNGKVLTRVRDKDSQLCDITIRHELSGAQSLVA